MQSHTTNKRSQQPDVYIILGGGTDGTRNPVLFTKERVRAFVTPATRHADTPIIVSGGYSMWVNNAPKYCEADAMMWYLSQHGFEKKRILVERRSRDTLGNAYFSKLIVKKHPSWKRICLITTRGHDRRSLWIFNKVFGHAYQFSVMRVPTQLPTFANNPRRQAYERYIQRVIYAKFFSICDGGDDAVLWRAMKKYHPAHSRSPEAKNIARIIMQAKMKYLGHVELSAEKKHH